PVYKKLKEMILNNQLKPGEKIIQEKIAKQLGVSRTPLLKALQMLEYELLVESIPRRGIYVKELEINEMIDVFDCRESLEGLAARLLAERKTKSVVEKLKSLFVNFDPKNLNQNDYRKSDERFHQMLIDYSGNSMLKRLYFFGNVHTKVVQTGLVRAPEETYEEHIAIINAIEAGDEVRAEAETRNHIKRSRDLLLTHLQEKEPA
ncbi:MAG: GntR family transcriptional regulator, partial [Bacteroidales bacterium]|nr:GntR family transcriptional regulator [Bacteroidales bacterium]